MINGTRAHLDKQAFCSVNLCLGKMNVLSWTPWPLSCSAVEYTVCHMLKVQGNGMSTTTQHHLCTEAKSMSVGKNSDLLQGNVFFRKLRKEGGNTSTLPHKHTGTSTYGDTNSHNMDTRTCGQKDTDAQDTSIS